MNLPAGFAVQFGIRQLYPHQITNVNFQAEDEEGNEGIAVYTTAGGDPIFFDKDFHASYEAVKQFLTDSRWNDVYLSEDDDVEGD